MAYELTIFESITTESALHQLEETAEKYNDLYCDMNNKDERKFVKEKASLILDLRKQVDRKRIDEVKKYKVEVEAKAKQIDDRLASANAPFSLLIDGYKKERAEVLAQQKAVDDAKALEIKIKDDHESAIMHNKIFDIEKREEIHLQLLHEEQIRKDAIANAENEKVRIIEQAKIDQEQAVKAESDRLAAIQQANLDDELTRMANVEHITATCKGAKESLMQHANLTEDQAIEAVKSIRKNLIQNVQIKF